MELIKTEIEDVKLIKPDVFRDQRGYFYESYNKPKFTDLGIPVDFIQDNESLSSKGVLRGLHFQIPPYAQGKLIRVVKGAVLDVAVDLRKESPTFGKYVSFELSEENKLICWIPPGFAHGFLTLRDETIFSYKCSNYYHRESERSIRWNDPDIGIDWNFPDPLLSEKDKDAMLFKSFISPF
jgi:dTDP-4-dehydrorhamnose 3,5-epimerase